MTCCWRPVGLEDEPRFRKIFEQMSPESRYLRFFSGANPVPDAVRAHAGGCRW